MHVFLTLSVFCVFIAQMVVTIFNKAGCQPFEYSIHAKQARLINSDWTQLSAKGGESNIMTIIREKKPSHWI